MFKIICTNIKLIALIISTSLSIFNIIFLIKTNKKCIKIKYNNRFQISKDNDKETALIWVDITNRNQFPIKISKIKINGIYVYNHKVFLGTGSEVVFNQNIEEIGYSTELPIKLDMFDSINCVLLIRSDKLIKYKRINFITLYTSRGVVHKRFFRKNNMK